MTSPPATDAPERIYHWLETQVSIARHYGGMHVNGHNYCIAYDEPGQPLVREDVLRRETREQRCAKAEQRKADQAKQGVLL